MTRMIMAFVMGIVMVARPLLAGEPSEGNGCREVKFRACDDKTGAGFFWVDTQSGKTWRLDAATTAWVYCGRPDHAFPSPYGTYIPRANKSGPGIFILNTATGEGWWMDGQRWKNLGVPHDRAMKEPEPEKQPEDKPTDPEP